ncbi:putative reverse transcriptase domain-containing protein [Tanacetum coccineum]
MRQRCWIELFNDYDCEIHYHPGKANVVADGLSRKERIKPKRIRAMNMTLQSNFKDKILAAQKEASDEAHKLKYYVHPGADKMYYDLRDMYWWPGMKKDIAVTSSGHDAIWVIVDWLPKSSHLLPTHEDYMMDRLARLYLNEIVARHGMLISVISDCDSRFTSSVRCAPFEALCGRKYRSPIMWAEVREGQLIRPELMQETTEKISQIKDRLKAVHDCVVRFGKNGKLAPRFVRPFEITKRIGPVAYRLRLSEEPNGIRDTFHVSNLKNYFADPTLKIPMDDIWVDAKLSFVEEPVEI